MTRKRIHELAKDWGVDTRQVLTRLEEQGIHGKKAQSTLTDHETALVRPGAVSQAAPSLVLGEEKLVHERVATEMDQKSDHLVTAREEVRERRISNAVIRRRTTRVSEEEAPASQPPGEPQFTSPALDEPFAAPLPLAFDLPIEPAPVVPVIPGEEGVPPEVSVAEPVSAPPPPTAVPPPPPPTPPHVERQPVVVAPPVVPPPEAPRPSRVLGRIDLGKLVAEPKPRTEVRPRAQAAPAAPSVSAPRAPVADGGEEAL